GEGVAGTREGERRHSGSGNLDPPAPERLRLLPAQRGISARRACQRRRASHADVSETQAQAPCIAVITARVEGSASMKQFVVQIAVLVVLAGAFVAAQQPSPPPKDSGM